MRSEPTNQPELHCQWCGGTIPLNEPVCRDCGAARPREDLVASGFEPRSQPLHGLEPREPAVDDTDEAKARQILKDLDAYVPDEQPLTKPRSTDPVEDAMVIIGILLAGLVVGGLTGWFLAPPLLHEFFQDVIGVESDGPEAFRRLGAFVGALVAMLFGALLATIVRR
jgi:hypothetical protein